ncbi:MAG: hypothetical protein PCFJNLEI_01670 [Verrucomicrobiae bacterium]|nr:hypothetical protein [Verrucomicrobiae bacterium]
MTRILLNVLVTLALLAPVTVRAHCDTLDGPVVNAAKVALEKGDVNLVLIWVQKKDEAEIKKAFDKTLAVRKQSAEAKELADTYFFETLVRVHRAAEGAPYTGLKPAGEIEPPIAAADKALETGKVDNLANEVSKAVADGIRKRFTRSLEAKKHADHNVAAGREYVAAYVEFVHYVERLHTAAGSTHGHQTESANPHENH